MKATPENERPGGNRGEQNSNCEATVTAPDDHVNGKLNEKSPTSRGWFRAMRSDDALELLRANKNAFLLLYVIAFRAQWKQGFNRFNLEQGQAFIGDHYNYGMSEREYRTAKEKLGEWGFATFKASSKGTVATLTSTSVFSILGGDNDDQSDTRRTSGRRAGDGQATTTKTVKKAKTKEEGEEQAPAEAQLSGAERVSREKELDRVEAAMNRITNSYDAHQAWSNTERTEFNRLKKRLDELKTILGCQA